MSKYTNNANTSSHAFFLFDLKKYINITMVLMESKVHFIFLSKFFLYYFSSSIDFQRTSTCMHFRQTFSNILHTGNLAYLFYDCQSIHQFFINKSASNQFLPLVQCFKNCLKFNPLVHSST